MAFRRKKVYKFSDEVMVKDAIISLLFGILSLIGVLTGIIISVVKLGDVPEYLGYIVLACGIMAVTGILFAIFAYINTEGGVLSKRMALFLSLLDLALVVLLYFI